MAAIELPQLLTPEQVAQLPGVHTNTLAIWRSIRYRAADVQAFIDSRLLPGWRHDSGHHKNESVTTSRSRDLEVSGEGGGMNPKFDTGPLVMYAKRFSLDRPNTQPHNINIGFFPT